MVVDTSANACKRAMFSEKSEVVLVAESELDSLTPAVSFVCFLTNGTMRLVSCKHGRLDKGCRNSLAIEETHDFEELSSARVRILNVLERNLPGKND